MPADDDGRSGTGSREENRDREGTAADLVVPFAVYVLLIAAGLAIGIVVGLTHA